MPKKIFLVRHAKSSWTDFSLSDFERPLDERGSKDAPIMADYIKNKDVKPDALISSPAMRAKTTAQFFDKVFGAGVVYVDALYHGHPQDFLNEIYGLTEDKTCVMLFAHNPGITMVANLVDFGCTDNVSTCGVVELEMDTRILWNEADWTEMRLIGIHIPKGI